MAAVIQKASVDVHGAPDFNAPTVATLKRNAQVKVSGQQGLWFSIELPAGKSGYVRVNDVRMAYAGKDYSSSNVRALFSGKAGKGRVTETAGVRGLDESDLKSAGFDAAQFAKLESYRATPEAAAAHARANGWSDTRVAYALEAKPRQRQERRREPGAEARRPVVRARPAVGDRRQRAAASAIRRWMSPMPPAASPKRSRPPRNSRSARRSPAASSARRSWWHDDAAQRRVNNIGRWMASHTTRPELPWTFGIIDTPEVNAFAAPGGYVLVTRGLYELLADDGEVAAVLGHEISHVVQRDHYNVIRKQEIASATENAVAGQVNVGGGIAGQMAKDYVRRHGATVMLTSLDRDAEFRSDEASEIYLARSGFNPLALYAVLQKMTALGTASASLAQLYKTHPPLDDRLDRIDRRGYAGLEAYTQRK